MFMGEVRGVADVNSAHASWDTYRESPIAIGWTEDACRHMHKIANEDTVSPEINSNDFGFFWN